MTDPKFAEPTKYDSVFWVEVDKIHPNPYQPRKEFEENALNALAESIRQYGVLQPLVVTRKESEKEDGGLTTTYELIAGERRLRASKIAGLREVPVVIRSGEENSRMKLEIAIIENLQREDLNSIDKAKAFKQLAEEFGLTHAEVAARVGRSRENITNTIRLLGLPEHMQQAIVEGKMTEGHGRPLLMVGDKPEEQETLFKEIITRKISVRDTEKYARRIAVDKTRKKDLTPEMQTLERELTDALGTRVYIERKEKGGKVVIDFFSDDDLSSLRDHITQKLEEQIEEQEAQQAQEEVVSEAKVENLEHQEETSQPEEAPATIDESTQDDSATPEDAPAEEPQEQPEKKEDDPTTEIKNFSL